LGYFLRAYLYFDSKYGEGQEVSGISGILLSVLKVARQDLSITLHHIYGVLRTPRAYIRNDPWAGLPELTNKDGAFCYDSCATQAWSASTILDILEEINELS
jgi:glycogen debranching enzyme